MSEARDSIPIYPEVSFDDRDLRGIANLFIGDWVWRAYRSRIGETETDPYRIRVRQLSHTPGRRMTVTYLAEWDPDEFIPPESFVIELDRDQSVKLFRYPEDPHLPGLSEAASAESALRLVNKYVLAVPARRLRVDMVRYRPGNRAVLRHRVGRVRFYTRVVRPSAVSPLLDAAELTAHSGFISPRIAGCWADGGVIWLLEIPGRNLRQYIRRGNQPDPNLLLDGLEKLWDAPNQTAGARPFNLAGAYRRAKRVFRRALREREAGRRILHYAANALDSFVASWQPSHIAHNDFYDDQMLVLPDGGIALVDFEETGPGDPMLDVGNFLAHLRWGYQFGRGREAEARRAYHDIFRRTALERFGWDERELSLREGVCLFRICTNAIRHPQPDWLCRLNTGLSVVGEITR